MLSLSGVGVGGNVERRGYNDEWVLVAMLKGGVGVRGGQERLGLGGRSAGRVALYHCPITLESFCIARQGVLTVN